MTDFVVTAGSSRRAHEVDAVVRVAAMCIVVSTVTATVAIGGKILVPVVEAVLFWCVFNALAGSIRRLSRIGPILSESAARWVAAALLGLIGVLSGYRSIWSPAHMGPQAMNLQTSLDPLVRAVSAVFWQETGVVMDRSLDVIAVETLVRQILLGFLGLLNQFGLVALYVAFLLVDQAYFPAKLRLLIPDTARHAAATALLTDLREQIGAYPRIMSKVSAAAAGLSLLAMLVAGLENPFFGAMVVFPLNFIPMIGSVLGVSLPAVFALVQFQDVGAAALLALALGVVQFTVGNILLPRMAGQTLNLSLTVTVVWLFMWGALWGVTGMLLAVPLTASLLLVASCFEATRAIVVALFRTGEMSPGQDRPPPSPNTISRNLPKGDAP